MERKSEAILWFSHAISGMEPVGDGSVTTMFGPWITREFIDAVRSLVGSDSVIDLAPDEPYEHEGGQEVYLLRIPHKREEQGTQGELILTHDNAETMLYDPPDAPAEIRELYDKFIKSGDSAAS